MILCFLCFTVYSSLLLVQVWPYEVSGLDVKILDRRSDIIFMCVMCYVEIIEHHTVWSKLFNVWIDWNWTIKKITQRNIFCMEYHALAWPVEEANHSFLRQMTRGINKNINKHKFPSPQSFSSDALHLARNTSRRQANWMLIVCAMSLTAYFPWGLPDTTGTSP